MVTVNTIINYNHNIVQKAVPLNGENIMAKIELPHNGDAKIHI